MNKIKELENEYKSALDYFTKNGLTEQEDDAMKKYREIQKAKQLLENGRMSRNECLRNYISRLGAIICDLTKEGWKFDTYFEKINGGKDYVYKLVDSPYERKEYRVGGEPKAVEYVKKQNYV